MNNLFKFKDKTKVFVYNQPTNMACSFPRLIETVNGWNNTPEAKSGHVFLFVNKKRCYCKALFWSKGGWCILAKKLEHGKLNLELDGGNLTIEELDAALDVELPKQQKLLARAA